MKFTPTPIPGVHTVEYQRFHDDRGFFAPVWIAETFAKHGLEHQILQTSVAYNKFRGTIRGLHYQVPPFQEVKIVRVIRGAVFDVAVDLRRDSPTFKRWVGITLDAENCRMAYLPAGIAHGYQTLTDDAEVLYTVSARYSPEHARGVRWNDPAFGIEWPLDVPPIINERDRTYPDFDPTAV